MKVECPTCNADSSESHISVHCGVNVEGKPFVHVAWGTQLRVQFSPEEARQHALTILAVAEAAESDSCVFQWMRTEFQANPDNAARAIGQLRNYRQK